FGQPHVQRAQAGIGLHAQEVGPDDRDHPMLLDVIEEIVPGVVVKALHGTGCSGQRGHGGRHLIGRGSLLLKPLAMREFAGARPARSRLAPALIIAGWMRALRSASTNVSNWLRRTVPRVTSRRRSRS